MASAAQASLLRQQEELDRKAAELERKERELQNTAANLHGEGDCRLWASVPAVGAFPEPAWSRAAPELCRALDHLSGAGASGGRAARWRPGGPQRGPRGCRLFLHSFPAHLGPFALFPSAFGIHYLGVGLWVFVPHPTLPVPLPTHGDPDSHLPVPFWEPWSGP